MKSKKFMLILLAFVMVFAMVGCSSNTEVASGNQIKDGTYTGVGIGRGGDITVDVTIKDDTITGIEVKDHAESKGLDEAMDILTKKVLENNTTKVDSVSGCTLTSHGFLSAIRDALKNADASIDMLKKVEVAKIEKEEVEETTDVVVIGAGGGGFSAAIEAKEAGADVIILEKMPIPGGNTLLAGGEYAAPNNWIQERDGIEDSIEKFKEDILNGGDNIADEELVDVVAENALAGAEWLRDDVGVVFEDEIMFFGGHSVKRSLIPEGGTGYSIISKQRQKAEELGIPLLLETKATELIMEDGKVVGVKAESEDKSYTFKANKGVVVATGGFGSNMDLRAKYNKDIDENILSTNSVGSTGDGILMAEDIGADLVGMEYIQTYPVCDPKSGSLLYFGDSRLFGHAILVNKEGNRFVEELERRDVISMAIKDQTDHVAYQLIDQVGLEESKVGEKHGPEMEYLFNQGLLVKADTLEEAAEFFDIDKDNFVKTVETYNKYVAEGEDKDFNKRLLTNPIEQGPFYLMKAMPAVHHTMGGIRINKNAEVINTAGEVIEGLFAAGEVTGGIHGTNRLGSNAIADIVVFGRIAGRNAANN